MRILVTGCAGFVGTNLVMALLKKGYSVVGLDNLSWGKLSNLREARKNPRFAFVRGDVRDSRLVGRLLRRCDQVVHLAAFKIPRYGNSLQTLHTNSVGTLNLLELNRRLRRRIIFASTSDVYGKNPSVPFAEEHDLVMGAPTHRRWAYAVSKMFDEHLLIAYQEEYGIPYTILRFFGSYGPYQSLDWHGGPQAVFIGQILRREPVTIHGDGKQTRSFTYVDDTVEGVVRALESEKAVNHIFNIGADREITILGLAELIHRLSGVRGKLKVRYISYEKFPGRYEDVRRRIPDTTKAQSLLGFKARIGLEEGLVRTIAWQAKVQNLKLPDRFPAHGA